MLNKNITSYDVKREFAILKNKARKALSGNKAELAALYLEKAARLMYNYSLLYSDGEIEEMIHELANRISISIDADNICEDRVVVVDSFGFSYRGLAWIYCKALLDNNKKLLFVVTDSARDTESFRDLREFLETNGASIAYFSEKTYTKATQQLAGVIGKFKPRSVFFHGTPWDVSALTSISALPAYVDKYQINLTDHAFWIGSTVFDHCLEFREYGRSISFFKRGMPEEKLHCLPYYPMQTIGDTPFQGLPFDTADKYFVSGGSAYKTEGSNTFPSLVESLLGLDVSMRFVFLSNDIPHWWSRLERMFPGRVYRLDERKDLVPILSRARFCLSTYPLYGGLMTQIAAVAGVVPLTLKREGMEDASRLLPCREVTIDYSTENELLVEAERLIRDEAYRKMRAKEMRSSVMDSTKFAKNLAEAMRGDMRFAMPIAEPDDSDLIRLGMERNGTFGKMGLACLSKRDVRHRTLFSKLTIAGVLEYVRVHAAKIPEETDVAVR